MRTSRTLGGLLGPAAFIGAWAVLGRRVHGYSVIDDPISRLAAVGAPTRVAMTGGLVAYAVGVGAYRRELRAALPGPTATAAALGALGALGIAATPLESSVGGAPHAVAAGLTYAALAATPLFAAGPLATQGHRGAARASRVAGVASATCLARSAASAGGTGLWQRLGLTTGHLWLMVSAAWLLRHHARGRQ